MFHWFRKPTDAPRLTDAKEINDLFNRSRLSVILCVTLGYSLMYTTRLPLSVIKKPLIDSGIFSIQELGTIGAALLYGYAFGKFINGFLADHARLRAFFTIGIFISALVNLCMGWVSSVFFASFLWAINGWVQGFGAPVAAVSLGNWFSRRERGTFYGIWSTAHSIGEGLTFAGTSVLVAAYGWRYGFWGPGLVGLVSATAIFIFMRDRPTSMGLPTVAEWRNDYPEVQPAPIKGEVSVMRTQLSLLKNPIIWVLGLSSAAMYVSRYAINSWGILYLQEVRGYTLAEAGGILGLNALAGVAGCLAYGLISDRLFKGRRPPVTLIFGLLEIGSLFLIFFTPAHHPALLVTGFLLYGFTLSGLLAVLGGLFAIDLVPKETAGAAMGIVGVFSYLAAGAQESISGHLIEKGRTVVSGVVSYDFHPAITFWISASVVSVVLASLLWRTKTRN